MGPAGMTLAFGLCLAAVLAAATASDYSNAADETQGIRVRKLLQGIDELPPIPPGFGFAIECGVRYRFSYMVSVRSRTGDHNCGGALFKENWVATAAHCADPRSDSASAFNPTVHISGRDLLEPVEILQTVRTEYHPSWNGRVESGNNLALLKLENNSCMDPIQLPNAKIDFPDDELIFVSWGRQADSGAFSSSLQAGNYTHIPKKECEEFDLDFEINKTMMCAQGETTAGLCQGDAGSPLVYTPSPFEPTTTLIGIGSFTPGSCTSNEIPSIFTNIPNTVKWIKSKIKEDKDENEDGEEDGNKQDLGKNKN